MSLAISSWLRRRRVMNVLGVVAAMCLMSVFFAPPALFLAGGVVRTVLLAGIGVALAGGVLLLPAFGIVEHSFVRARQERMITCGLWAAVTFAAADALSAAGEANTGAIWTLLLSGATAAGVTVRLEAAWWIPLGLGLGGITIDLVLPAYTATRALSTLGIGWPCLVAGAGAVLYVVRGPTAGSDWA